MDNHKIIDNHKIRRETMRWNILLTLNNARPIGAYAELILAAQQAVFPDATLKEIVIELDFLFRCECIELNKQPSGRFHADLSCAGINIVEFTIDCPVGIARPPKYWT